MDKKITNEEKAKEIATRWKAKGLPYNAIYDTAIEVMEWKDEQHKQEEQQTIDKACKLMQHWILEHDYVDIIELEDYIKQQIEK